ncbi:MAG TPA: DUF4266 domain-containing protein [Opitutaceae bacterium]|nr:DUF4266 domain-containing protein [Opitutaceae bacterium]
MRNMRTRFVLIGALAGAALLSGCASQAAVRVRPWERAALADEAMNPVRDPLGATMLEHVYFSREAASGGRGVGGSGCGCN